MIISLSSQRTGTPTSPPTQPLPSAMPPPRPPKKAELAGNPLSPPASSETSTEHFISAPRTHQQPHTPAAQDPDSRDSSSSSMMGVASDLTMPPSLPSTSSMDEQLQELKRQQQLQLRTFTDALESQDSSSETSESSVTRVAPQVGPHPSYQATPTMDQPDLQLVGQGGDGLHSLEAPPPGGQSSSFQAADQPLLSMGGTPPSHQAPPPVGQPIGGGNTASANQALLDLHMLLQPPGGPTSSLTTPLLQPGPAPSEPWVGFAETTHPRLGGMGVSGEPTRPPKPAHLQSVEIPPPDHVVMHSPQFPAPVNPAQSFPPEGRIEGTAQDGSLTPDVNSLMATATGTFPPINPAQSMPSLHRIEGVAQNGSSLTPNVNSLMAPATGTLNPVPAARPPQTESAVPDVAAQNLSIGSQGGEVPSQQLPPTTPLPFDVVSTTPQLLSPALQGNAESAANLSSAVDGSFVGVDNTMTIASMSRPIPAPVLSPPMSPSQRLDPNLGQPVLSPPMSQIQRLEPNPVSPMSQRLEPNPDRPPSMSLSQRLEPNLDRPQSNLEPEPGTLVESSSFPPGGHRMSSALYSGLLDTRYGAGEGSVQGGHVEHGTNTPPPRVESEDGLVPSQSDIHSTLDSNSVSSLPEDQVHARVALDLSSGALQRHHTAISPATVATSMSSLAFSHGLDVDLHSLPRLSETSFRPIPGLGPGGSLRTPPSMSPLALDASSRLTQQANIEHIQALLSSNRTLQQSLDERTREAEQLRASLADHRTQLDNYKQQLFVLQQQLGQVSHQQQKQEQEKATASGQQAVLMQLLQQQQGMFSQQQAQIESLSKVSDGHSKEQMELEVKHRQALAVEQERNASLLEKNAQQGHEVQRLQQQVQTLSQQQQMVQVHLYQYQTQIQERDKQLLAFRGQHKDIIQNLEHKYQQKVSQLVLQIQELQGDMKKARSQRQSLPVPLQPMKGQQFSPQAVRSPQQQQFLPQIPSTPINPHLTTAAGGQVGSPKNLPSASAHPQVPPQPQGFQSQASGGLVQRQSSNPATPHHQQQQQQQQQQLPNPLTPQPAKPTAMPPMPPQLGPQKAGIADQSLSMIPSQPPGNLGGSQGSDPGISHQQYRTAPLPQTTIMQPTPQPGHMISQPSHVTQGAPPQGANPAGQGLSHHGGQILAQGSNPQLQSLPPHAISSTAGNIHPQQMGGFQMGRSGVPPAQGANIQQMQGMLCSLRCFIQLAYPNCLCRSISAAHWCTIPPERCAASTTEHATYATEPSTCASEPSTCSSSEPPTPVCGRWWSDSAKHGIPWWHATTTATTATATAATTTTATAATTGPSGIPPSAARATTATTFASFATVIGSCCCFNAVARVSARSCIIAIALVQL